MEIATGKAVARIASGEIHRGERWWQRTAHARPCERRLSRTSIANSLKQFLGEGTPSRDFDALVTADAAYDKQISELIRRANNEGWIGDLVNTVLEARKGNARFVAAVGPIADQIKKDGELPPDEAPEGRIPTPSPLIWIVLSLSIIVAGVATKALSEELPVWLIPAVIVALLFLALGITTLILPRQRALVDLYATDQSLIKGIGVSGLVLLLALAVSGFYAGSAAWPRIVEYATPLPDADKNAALSVLVAQLEGDDKRRSQTKHVIDSLEGLLPARRGSSRADFRCEAHVNRGT